MHLLLSGLLFLSLPLYGVPQAKAPAKKKESDRVEFVLKAGDVAEVSVKETLQKNTIDELKGGRLTPGVVKLYKTDKEAIPFYQVSFQLEPEAAKALEALTAASYDKKLVLKANGKKLHEAWIKAAIGSGPIVIEPERPKYNAKSDGSKESAQSKANAEKLAKQFEKLIKKK